MINLIKNELFKIFHKKSTIIILIIMLFVCLLNNFVVYRISNTNMFYYSGYEEPAYVKEFLSRHKNNKDYIEEYAYYTALDDTYTKMGDYYNDQDSWQFNAYMDNYFNIATKYYEEKIINNNDQDDLKEELDNIDKTIKDGNWKYFIHEKIDELIEQLAFVEDMKNNNQVRTNNKNEIEMQIFQLQEKIKLYEYRLDENIPVARDYLNTAINIVDDSLYGVAAYKYGDVDTKKGYEGATKDYYVNKYALENKIDLNDYKSLRSFLIDFFDSYYFIILVFIVMIAGTLVSEEFNKGTIKSLLILPYSRVKILLAKYLTMVILLIGAILYMYVLQILVGGIFFGFSSLSIPYVTYNFAKEALEVANLFKYSVLIIISNIPKLLLLATLAFALSTIINNTAFAIAITFCGTIGETVLDMLYMHYNFKILDYFVTNNWNFSEFLFGGSSSFGLSLTHGVIVCLVYLLIMLIASFIVFIKRDIKNI